MSVGDEKQWKDLQQLRRMYSLKDSRTPSRSLTAHGLPLERDLEGYRKDVEELNRMFALDDPRQERGLSRLAKGADSARKGPRKTLGSMRTSGPTMRSLSGWNRRCRKSNSISSARGNRRRWNGRCSGQSRHTEGHDDGRN